MTVPRTRLPANWQLFFGDAPPGTTTVLTLRPSDLEGCTALSLTYLRQGLTPWAIQVFPEGPLQVGLESFPHFDEALCLYFWCALAGQEKPDCQHWEALAHYANDVRQGFWPDQLAPNQALQSLYGAITQTHRSGLELARGSWVQIVFAMFDRVFEQLNAGVALLTTPLFDGDPNFARYVATLKDDRRIYEADRARGRAYFAALPQPYGGTAQERRLSLLVVETPMALQFKEWARQDERAPGDGPSGYDLLLVSPREGVWVLSADPTRRIALGWLAPLLTGAETHARGVADGAQWYDGANHEGTLVANPTGGTRLGVQQVLEVLTQHLKLAPVAEEREVKGVASHRARPSKAVLALLGGLVLAFLWVAPLSPRDEGSPTRGEAAKGEQILEQNRSPQKRTGRAENQGAYRALIIGIDDYPSHAWPHLTTPVKDATDFRTVLVERYGFKDTDIVLLKNKEATYNGITRALDKMGEVAKPDDSVIIYYAGHGSLEKQVAGCWVPSDSTHKSCNGGIASSHVWDRVQKIDAKHVLLISDSCFAGDFIQASRGNHEPKNAHQGKLDKLASVRSRELLLSGADEPVPDGKGSHSPFAQALLESLRELGEEPFTAESLYTSIRHKLKDREGVPNPVHDNKQIEEREFGAFVFRRRQGITP